MYLAQRVGTASHLRDIFVNWGREGSFSNKGFEVLFNHLQELAAMTQSPMEINVVQICCEYAEIRISEIERETGAESLDDLKESTTVLEVDENYIIYSIF